MKERIISACNEIFNFYYKYLGKEILWYMLVYSVSSLAAIVFCHLCGGILK